MRRELTIVNNTDLRSMSFDLGFWAAGYESRSSYIVRSEFKPQIPEDQWIRVEFAEDREAAFGHDARGLGLGTPLGGGPQKRSWDTNWRSLFERTIRAQADALGRRVRVFCDYSSMPRTVYGSILVSSLQMHEDLIELLTLAYVPGVHEPDINGCCQLNGLRTILGLEGHSATDQSPALVLGLGYDGALAEALVDIYQFDRFSVFAAGAPDSMTLARCLHENRSVTKRAEFVEFVPLADTLATMESIDRQCRWYRDRRDVILVCLGPKPVVLASILIALLNPRIAFRCLRTGPSRPAEVQVLRGTAPLLTTLTFASEELTVPSSEAVAP